MGGQLIGACADDFNLPVKQALQACSRIGFRAVEIGAARGEITPKTLSESGKKHLVRMCRNLGLSPVGLTLERGGPGWADASVVDQRVEQAKLVLELAAGLDVAIVSVQVGSLLGREGTAAPHAVEAIRSVADHADRVGTLFAVQTGADVPADLAETLEHIACPALRVCVDPATLTRFGYDPVDAVESLAAVIGLSRVGDATAGRADRPGMETTLGRGQLDLHRYIAGLAAADYFGPLMLRRRESHHAIRDLETDLHHLRRALE